MFCLHPRWLLDFKFRTGEGCSSAYSFYASVNSAADESRTPNSHWVEHSVHVEASVTLITTSSLTISVTSEPLDKQQGRVCAVLLQTT